MKRTGLYGVSLGCAICVGICAGRVATAGDYVDCSKLETWSQSHSSYDQGKRGSDSQWTEVAACKGGTDPH